VSALEEEIQVRFEKGGEENLIFSCILSLNPYQSEVNNMLQMIYSSNFMFDEGLCRIKIMWNYRNDTNYDWTMLECMY